MSVAFRRESDEEHLEPSFALPIPPGPNLVTARGKTLIDARVQHFEAALAATIASGVDEAAIKMVKRDLAYWQTRQITAETAAAPSGERVEFGTTVAFTLNGAARTLAIVGLDEAAGAEGLVAFSAPLARAMMAAEVGDVLPFGGRDEAIEILSISRSADRPAPSAP
jgi:transcription elongation GreA/GreB family factor